MQLVWVALAFGSAILLALALLFAFHARWYWHVLSVLAAGAVGLTPPPEPWRPPDLLVGSVFFFLLVWGVAAPFFRAHHPEPVRRFPHVA